MEFYYLKLLSLLELLKELPQLRREVLRVGAVYPGLVGYKGMRGTELVREKAFAPADSFIEEKIFIWAGSLMP